MHSRKHLRLYYAYFLQLLNRMIYLIVFALGFIAGLLVMRKHRASAESIEAKGRSLLDALKGK